MLEFTCVVFERDNLNHISNTNRYLSGEIQKDGSGTRKGSIVNVMNVLENVERE